jgi:hypothetical protein
MSEKPISPLRQRMLEDMNMRRLPVLRFMKSNRVQAGQVPSYSFSGTSSSSSQCRTFHRYRRAGEQDLSHREIMMALRRRGMV